MKSLHATPNTTRHTAPQATLRAALLLLFAALLVGQPTRLHANELPMAKPGQVGMSGAKLKAVDVAMAKLIEDGKIAGGVVIVAHNGKVCLFNAYGQRDTKPNVPMQKDTIFRIFSMTKAIATAAAMTLVDEGKMNVNDPVAKFIPELKNVMVHDGTKLVKPKRPITIADLMRHTAGYSYGSGNKAVREAYQKHSPRGAVDLEAMAERLSHIPLAYQPGDEWIYSISIDVLGLVIERASGQKLDKFLEQRIFVPLDMKDTGFHCPKEKHDRFAALFNLKDGKLQRSDNPQFSEPVTLFSAGGGLVSTARDYMHFLMMIRNGGTLFGKRILKAETVKLMTANQLPERAFPIGFGKQVRDGVGFGFGFAVCVNKSKFDAARPVGEFGWGGAASTHYWGSPKDDLIVVTLEQRRPYSFDTEFTLKPLIYDAIKNR